MNQFDRDHDAAIRSVLRDEVVRDHRRRPERSVVAKASLALLGALAIGGGGYAVASTAPHLVGAAQPTPSATAPRPAPTPSPAASAPIRMTPTPALPPTTAAGPSGEAIPMLAAPVITAPADGQTFPAGSAVTIAGTGTPGAHVFVTENCTLAPPACTVPELFGQPWQTPIIVGADGHWSTTQVVSPPQTTGMRVTATQAESTADGSSIGGSPFSAPRTYTVTGTGG